MGHYHNFTTVIYCTAQWAARVTEAELLEQLRFFKHYVNPDKVYLETFRGEQTPSEQLALCKKIFAENGIAVSGGITTVTPDLNTEDAKRQRFFSTFCYSNEAHRELLKKVAIYTAENFDEFILDDFFFSQCRCEDCQKEKGNKSWAEFKLEKMREVSENLVIGPAKKANPKVRITIKYPNWRESFQETGYNPAQQKDMFDRIYTGTETRHPVETEQHLPHYLSYSLMRFFENTAPGRNGGGWFDPYECYSIDNYLEQGYLTAFSKPKEVMLFCWPSLYNNKVVTPLGLRLRDIDGILSRLGRPVGLPVYLPHNSQGEDHLEDYLGMLGIPFEPAPDFPAYSDTPNPAPGTAKSVFLTASSLYDEKIVPKIRDFINRGGKVIATSGFILGALAQKTGIEEITSARFRGRYIDAGEFHISKPGGGRMFYRSSAEKIRFPILEHRTNSSFALLHAASGDIHTSLLLRDTYGRGELITLTVPDTFSELKKLPREALTRIRQELCCGKMYLDAPAQVSLFTYDNDTFGLYSYTGMGSAPDWVRIHVRGNAAGLSPIMPGNPGPAAITPLYTDPEETVFELRTEPGEYQFYRLEG
ncbi:permease [Spirochaetia bacterium]|nr:permease [Spirochaetia bacterium]